MADDSGDDEIIAEYPLYSSTTAALFKTETQDIRVVQLQYPLRPQWRSYDTENMSEVKYKPNHRLLTLKVPEDRPDKVQISQQSVHTCLPSSPFVVHLQGESSILDVATCFRAAYFGCDI